MVNGLQQTKKFFSIQNPVHGSSIADRYASIKSLYGFFRWLFSQKYFSAFTQSSFNPALKMLVLVKQKVYVKGLDVGHTKKKLSELLFGSNVEKVVNKNKKI